MKGPIPLVHGFSDAEIERSLLAMAESFNQVVPIAARIQSRPDLVAKLLGPDHDTSKAAATGSAYNFEKRPFQRSRPRIFKLDKEQERAAMNEIERLEKVCGAVETAPDHDSDKALLPCATEWGKSPLPHGDWPRERKVPVLRSEAERSAYNQARMCEQLERRSLGRAFRDFESPVFTVPKKDGGTAYARTTAC